MAAASGQLGMILRALHAPATPENVRFLNAWVQAEGGSARFNPFNTTQGAAGASNYNSVGVRNYPSLQAGTAATVQTLLNGRYGGIVSRLRSGKATAMQLAQAEAATPWGTGALIEKVLGGHVPSTLPGGTAAPVVSGGRPASAAPANLEPLRANVLSALLAETGVKTPDYSGFLGALGAYRSAQAAAPSPLRPPRLPGTPPAPGASLPAPGATGTTGPVKYGGVSLSGVRPTFLRSVSAAAHAAGATKIQVISGYRSPSYNASVGGVSRSNHITGNAIDARAYVPGKGWVPIGTLLAPIAGRFGLRSGDQPGFYRGGRDPNHVDDGANQR